jgi:rhodanese-related sulfurtransferase
VVLLVVLMALFMFWGAEQLERIFGKKGPRQAPRWRYGAALALLAVAVAVVIVGQPTNADRWASISPEKEALLADREVQIHPGELLDILHDRQLKIVMLDVRDEVDYNLFHILDARHAPLDNLLAEVPALHLEPANAVFVLMSNDEERATVAWKLLVAESVPNIYILEGGINGWLAQFGDELAVVSNIPSGSDQLVYDFPAAIGDRHPAAEPDPHRYELDYVPKVELELKRAPTSGGCG